MEEEKLVKKLKNKDEEAFRIFMAQYKGIVYNIIYSVAGNSGDSDDIAQDVFITVFRKIRKFRGKSALSTWLYRITVNKCKDYFRKRRPTAELRENMPSMETDAVNEDLAKALLDGLPVKYRMPVALRLEGFSYGEIAASIKISLEKVKILIFRAKEKMRETLKHEM